METKIPVTPKSGLPMYTIMKDGNNQEYKIVNFDNPDMVPNKGIKIVRAIKQTSRHRASSSTRVERDPITGIMYAIPAGLDDIRKTFKFQLIELGDLRQFDLSVQQDRMEWAVVGRAKFLRDSPYGGQVKPTHYVYDVEAEAEKKNVNTSKRRQAYDIIDNLSQLQIIEMARNVGGINTLNVSLPVIKAELNDFVDSKEQGKGVTKFLEIWNSSNRAAMTIFKRCIAVGLVHLDTVSGYLWKKSHQLGANEPAAVAYITKNHSLLTAMDSESRSMDTRFGEFATAEEQEIVITSESLSPRVDDSILKRQEDLMRRMEAKEAELDKLLSKSKSASVVDIDAPPAPVATFGEAPFDLKALQDKAAKHGFKHAHVTKDVAKLNEWIDSNPIKA